ncbi:MAG: serine hydrolase [Bacteroidales bacterium]|nr:serine hydrolase [Bacteroidales bacterium]
MKRNVTFLLMLSILLSCGEKNSNREPAIIDREMGDKVDNLVQQYINLDIFSGVILIAEQGILYYHKAFGMADREKGIPNTVNTLFDIGSMNKTFTSIVIKQLIDEGKLDYDDSLKYFVEGFKDPMAENITVRHLLEHESGFGDYHDRGYFDQPEEQKTLQAIVDRTRSMTLEFEPGTEQMYSNTGYVLLGAIIESVSNMSYFRIVRERITRPLELTNTYLEDLDELESRRAKGYYKTVRGELVRNYNLIDLPNPDGGFLSTAEDVMKFYRSYYYDTLLLSKRIKDSDPFFKFLEDLPPGKAPVHAGGFEGFNTAIYQLVSDDISIVVLANMDEPVAENLGGDILALIRGQEPEKPSLPAVQLVYKSFNEEGIDYVRANFDELTLNFHPADPRDLILNIVGYTILAEDRINEAIELFRLNTELFPEVANCWDSLGEAYLIKGESTEAKKAYKRALELNPGLTSALEALKKL